MALTMGGSADVRVNGRAAEPLSAHFYLTSLVREALLVHLTWFILMNRLHLPFPLMSPLTVLCSFPASPNRTPDDMRCEETAYAYALR